MPIIILPFLLAAILFMGSVVYFLFSLIGIPPFATTIIILVCLVMTAQQKSRQRRV